MEVAESGAQCSASASCSSSASVAELEHSVYPELTTIVSVLVKNFSVPRFSLSDISDASVSTCSLISMILHSLGLLMASASARGERKGSTYNSRARRSRKEAAKVAVA